MELVKDIYFNTDKLIENTNVKVSYTGKFYQSNSEKVYLHYGYGKEWNNVNDIEMKKSDLGYQAELKLGAGETLNFCFKNQDNEWDNNFGKNYIFNIEKNAINAVQKDSQSKASTPAFFNKTFGKSEAKQPSTPFWTSESVVTNPQPFNAKSSVDENTSGVIEDVIHNTPTSIDTVIPKAGTKIQPIVNNATPTPKANVVNISDKVININTPKNITKIETGNVINPTFKTPAVVSINANVTQPTSINSAKPVQTFGVSGNPTNIINPIQKQPETSLALAPTGFNYWTKKVKDSVCKFFAYVPKLISGNFKRNLKNNNTNNNK